MLILVLLAAKGSAAEQFQDTTKLYRAARSAEAEYERAARRLAPLDPRPTRTSTGCDEVVGRFCVYYDSHRDTLPTEPRQIAEYRNRAIGALRAAYAVNPSRTATLFPLIRLLLEGKRPQEALAAAEVYRRSSGDVATANMLLGLTRHASADIPGAETAFADWLEASDSATARRITDLSQLLSGRERRRYRQMSSAARDAYHQRFWRYADALYLTPGNETRTEHFSRHAETRLLKTVPFVTEGMGWGDDVGELTIRYGTIKGRTRMWPTGLLEHWDPEQTIYAAPSLDSALNIRARPGAGWPLDTVRTISGHAPSTLRRMLAIEHQASLFHEGADQLLRVDAVLPLDMRAREAPNGRAVLFVLDSLLQIIATAPGFVSVTRDSMFVWSEARIPSAARFYSLEILEQNSGLAGRARFPIVFSPRGSLQLSDVLIAEEFPAAALPRNRADPALKPRAVLLIPRGLPIGIYAEAAVEGARPRTLRVRLRITNERRRDVSPAMSWVNEISSVGLTPIAATVGFEKLKPGRYWIELSVTDQEGRTGVAMRELVVPSK